MASKNILICGNYGAGNFGDELILKGLLKVAKTIPGFSVTVMSGNERETREWHGVETSPFVPSGVLSWAKNILNGKALRALRAIWKSDLVIFGGGGLFSEKESRSISIWAAQVRAFRWFRKEVVIVGQSFGEIHDTGNRKTIRKVVSGVRDLYVRDAASSENLKKLGVKRSIHVMHDSALWLTDEDFKAPAVTQEPYILLSLREWPGVDMAELLEKVDAMKYVIKEALGVPVKFLSMQKGAKSDLELYARLHDRKMTYIEPTDLDTLWSTVKASEFVISMRLHGCILAVLAKRSLLAISYDAKVENLLSDLGMVGNVVKMSDPLSAWLEQLQKVAIAEPSKSASRKADIHTFAKLLTKK